MIKPNLFIVGAAKSGTSSLWQYLRQHPEIYMPEDELYKEPCFFSAYGEGMGLGHYLKIFEKASTSHGYVGEASTVYLSDPTSAQRIFNFNPAARIIIMLRNPADRAYSLYNWMVQDGYEYAESFEEALMLEDKRLHKQIPNWHEPQYYWNYMYFRSGLYSEQVKRYIEKFKGNVLIIKFDDFKQSPAEEYAKVCAFLGIAPNKLERRVFNPSRHVISAKIQFILRKVTFGLIAAKRSGERKDMEKLVFKIYVECLEKLASVARFTLRDRVRGYLMIRKVMKVLGEDAFDQNIVTKDQRDKLMKLGWLEGKPRNMDNSVRTKLLKRYGDEIQMLSQITGQGFGEWAA